ncbi:MAG: type 3 dihydrofolate reductase [Gammaproteobacteria bacterium]
MSIVLIAAMTRNRIIGIQNRLPWHLPADLKHFKHLTLGKSVIMGRKTFESIGKPLPNRQNIVLTRQGLETKNRGELYIAPTLDAALKLANPHTDIMIIGGAKLFKQALPLASRMYLTIIDAPIPGDTYFPAWDPAEWHEVERKNHAPDEKNRYHYSFITLEKS